MKSDPRNEVPLVLAAFGGVFLVAGVLAVCDTRNPPIESGLVALQRQLGGSP